jgi:predicted hotdog family 3-hydroxylacyl-ACP dehydratase
MTPYPPLPELLPHTGRAILLDEVVEADDGRITCRVTSVRMRLSSSMASSPPW